MPSLVRVVRVVLVLALSAALLANFSSATRTGSGVHHLQKTQTLHRCPKLIKHHFPVSKGAKLDSRDACATLGTRTSASHWSRWSNHHCYLMYSTRATYPEAVSRCSSFGGHLVTLSTEDEVGFLIGTLRGKRAAHALGFWIGYTDEQEHGNWEWLNGEVAMEDNGGKFENWGLCEPKRKSANAHCAYVVSGSPEGRWKSALCGQRRPYVCEVANLPLPVEGDATNAARGLRIPNDLRVYLHEQARGMRIYTKYISATVNRSLLRLKTVKTEVMEGLKTATFDSTPSLRDVKKSLKVSRARMYIARRKYYARFSNIHADLLTLRRMLKTLKKTFKQVERPLKRTSKEFDSLQKRQKEDEEFLDGKVDDTKEKLKQLLEKRFIEHVDRTKEIESDSREIAMEYSSQEVELQDFHDKLQVKLFGDLNDMKVKLDELKSKFDIRADKLRALVKDWKKKVAKFLEDAAKAGEQKVRCDCDKPDNPGVMGNVFPCHCEGPAMLLSAMGLLDEIDKDKAKLMPSAGVDVAMNGGMFDSLDKPAVVSLPGGVSATVGGSPAQPEAASSNTTSAAPAPTTSTPAAPVDHNKSVFDDGSDPLHDENANSTSGAGVVPAAHMMEFLQLGESVENDPIEARQAKSMDDVSGSPQGLGRLKYFKGPVPVGTRCEHLRRSTFGTKAAAGPEGQCYIHFENNAKFSVARRHCVSLGGNLAVIRDENENEFLGEMFPELQNEPAWIGYVRPKGVLEWGWVNGEVHLDRLTGEPYGAFVSADAMRSGPSQRCTTVHMPVSHAKATLVWNPAQCNTTSTVLCEFSDAGKHVPENFAGEDLMRKNIRRYAFSRLKVVRKMGRPMKKRINDLSTLVDRLAVKGSEVLSIGSNHIPSTSRIRKSADVYDMLTMRLIRKIAVNTEAIEEKMPRTKHVFQTVLSNVRDIAKLDDILGIRFSEVNAQQGIISQRIHNVVKVLVRLKRKSDDQQKRKNKQLSETEKELRKIKYAFPKFLRRTADFKKKSKEMMDAYTKEKTDMIMNLLEYFKVMEEETQQQISEVTGMLGKKKEERDAKARNKRPMMCHCSHEIDGLGRYPCQCQGDVPVVGDGKGDTSTGPSFPKPLDFQSSGDMEALNLQNFWKHLQQFFGNIVKRAGTKDEDSTVDAPQSPEL